MLEPVALETLLDFSEGANCTYGTEDDFCHEGVTSGYQLRTASESEVETGQ